MSFNITKVQNIKPNNQGEIDLTVSDLISAVPNENEILKHESGAWGSSGVEMTPELGYGYHYQSSGGSGGSYTYSSGDRYIWRGGSNINSFGTGFSIATTTAANTPLTSNNSKWYMGFNIPAGKWLLSWQFNTYMTSSTAYSTWRFATCPSSSSTNYTYHSAQSYIKGTQSRFGGLIRCIVDISTPSFGCLVNQSLSGTIRISPSGSAHYVNAINITKL